MTDDESYVVKRRDDLDLNRIILSQNADALAEFLDEPVAAIAEALTGALAAGPKAWTTGAGRIVQSALKGKLFQQVSQEIKELRDKGKIPDHFTQEKNGFQSWVELLTIIDNESPDPERLDALKAMFFAVNKVNARDAERILAYQLFQIAKKLTSGQLLYLKACYEIYRARSVQSGIVSQYEWLTKVGTILGHNVSSLLNLDDLALTDLGLLSGRTLSDRSGLTQTNARLTDLGIKFCEEIQKYHLEAREQPGSEA